MKFLLDSNIIIYATKPGYDNLRQKLNDAFGDFCVSAITQLEVLGYHLLKESDQKELEFFFSHSEIIPIDGQIINTAIQLRQHRKITLGDSIIASTCINKGLELWTNNINDFKDIPDIMIFNPLQ